MIDSLNEREILKATPEPDTEIKGSISKLEQFLKASLLPNYQQYIKFLRNMQTLRSTGVGHRKGTNYEKIAATFGLRDGNRADVLRKILLQATELLLALENHFLQSSSDEPAT